MSTLRELVEYHKPTDLKEAIKLLQRPSVRTVPIAGGTALVPSVSRDVEAVVDLGALGLSYIMPAAGGFVIGATTTLQTIVDDQHARDYAGGVLVRAILDTASRHVREAATIAGSIVAGEGNSPLLTTLLALDARLIIRGDDEEETELSSWTPRDRTLILRVRLPAWAANTLAAYEKVARTPADQPIVCAAARAAMSTGKLIDARIALGGVGAQPVMIETADTTIDQAAQLAVKSINPPSDYFASADYRREMIGVLVRRVLSQLS